MFFLFYISLFFYQLTVYSTTILIRISGIWNSKHRKWIDGRRDIFSDIRSVIKSDENRIWIHCSSLGEFEQGRPVIEQIKKNYPGYKIFLTFFSPSGYEIRKNYSYADYVYYLPADTIRNARKFVGIVDPWLVIFVKYEFWYNYFQAINSRKIPLVLISAIFNKEKVFFKWWAVLFRKMLGKIDHIFVQDTTSMELLAGIGITNVSIAHDTRIDRVLQISNEGWKSDIAYIEEFCGNNHVLIAGSSYETEEEYILQLLENGSFSWKVILAPHNTDKSHIEGIRQLFGGMAVFWSDLQTSGSEIQVENYRVLVIDTIGLLAHLFKYASVALIGGGFGKSIHNILEPATFGLPVITGPNKHEKFKEATDLIQLGGVKLVYNYTDFEAAVTSFQDDNIRSTAGSINRKYIMDHAGGTAVVMEGLGRYLK
jgi:3-deoxy-D-manno-octulosonic-acid transferase